MSLQPVINAQQSVLDEIQQQINNLVSQTQKAQESFIVVPQPKQGYVKCNISKACTTGFEIGTVNEFEISQALRKNERNQNIIDANLSKIQSLLGQKNQEQSKLDNLLFNSDTRPNTKQAFNEPQTIVKTGLNIDPKLALIGAGVLLLL